MPHFIYMAEMMHYSIIQNNCTRSLFRAGLNILLYDGFKCYLFLKLLLLFLILSTKRIGTFFREWSLCQNPILNRSCDNYVPARHRIRWRKLLLVKSWQSPDLNSFSAILAVFSMKYVNIHSCHSKYVYNTLNDKRNVFYYLRSWVVANVTS